MKSTNSLSCETKKVYMRLYRRWLLLGSVLGLILVLTACTNSVQDELQTGVKDFEEQAANSFNRRIGSSSDDVEEAEDGTMYFESPDLDIVFDKASADRGKQQIGLRFPNIEVPQGATITEAHIYFTPDEAASGDANTAIRAILQGDAPSFSASKTLTGRQKTSVDVKWTLPLWDNVDEKDGQRTPNLAPVMQEIIDLPDWQSGNNISFVIAYGQGNRAADSYDGNPDTAPLLEVKFEETSVDNNSYDLKGDPNFDKSQLSGDTALWYDNFLVGLDALEEREAWDEAKTPKEYAGRGETRKMAREVGSHLNTLLQAFRVTGDYRLFERIDAIMEIARGELGDYRDDDNYLEWRPWSPNGGTNFSELEEVLSPPVIAEIAYAYQLNRSYSSVYNDRAAFWQDYLQNDFEAQWSDTLPALRAYVAHAQLDSVRYHYYMFKLTGEQVYYDTAIELADEGLYSNALSVKDQVVEVKNSATNGESVYVWEHKLDGQYGCQFLDYLDREFQVYQDLHLDGFSYPDGSLVFNEVYLERVARAFKLFVVDNYNEQEGYFPRDICGGIGNRGKDRTGVDGRTVVSNPEKRAGGATPGTWPESLFIERPDLAIAPWDDTGEIIKTGIEILCRRDEARRGIATSVNAIVYFALKGDDAQPIQSCNF